MKLGIWVGIPTRIILRSGPNSETPPGGRHLEFQNGRHSAHINLPNSKPMIDRNVLFVASPQYDVRHLGFQDGRHENQDFLRSREAKQIWTKFQRLSPCFNGQRNCFQMSINCQPS